MGKILSRRPLLADGKSIQLSKLTADDSNERDGDMGKLTFEEFAAISDSLFNVVGDSDITTKEPFSTENDHQVEETKVAA